LFGHLVTGIGKQSITHLPILNKSNVFVWARNGKPYDGCEAIPLSFDDFVPHIQWDEVTVHRVEDKDDGFVFEELGERYILPELPIHEWSLKYWGRITHLLMVSFTEISYGKIDHLSVTVGPIEVVYDIGAFRHGYPGIPVDEGGDGSFATNTFHNTPC
jgi:hypothetical protein